MRRLEGGGELQAARVVGVEIDFHRVGVAIEDVDAQFAVSEERRDERDRRDAPAHAVRRDDGRTVRGLNVDINSADPSKMQARHVLEDDLPLEERRENVVDFPHGKATRERKVREKLDRKQKGDGEDYRAAQEVAGEPQSAASQRLSGLCGHGQYASPMPIA